MTRRRLSVAVSTLGAAVSLSALAWLAPGCDLNPQPQPPGFDNAGSGHGSSSGGDDSGGSALTLDASLVPPWYWGDAASEASGPLPPISEGGSSSDAGGEASTGAADASADGSPDAGDAQSDAQGVDAQADDSNVDTACDVALEAGE